MHNQQPAERGKPQGCVAAAATAAQQRSATSQTSAVQQLHRSDADLCCGGVDELGAGLDGPAHPVVVGQPARGGRVGWDAR